MLDRRQMLATAAALWAGGAFTPTKAFTQDKDGRIFAGWVPPVGQPRPKRTRIRAIRGAGQNTVRLLWKELEELSGRPFEPHDQKIGDCTSQASTLGRKTLDAQHGIWTGDLCTETTYSGSRVQIGKGALGFDYNDRRGGGGSTGIWTAQWLKQFGVVPRGSYPEGDLSGYRSDLALRWGQPRAGCPQGLVAKCVRPIERFAIADNWLDACDLVASGVPVMICSPVGFGNGSLPVTPDHEGFLTPGVEWMHAMLLWGIDTKSMRHGGCIANSWGRNWINPRPHKLGTPAGCFWAEARVIDRMLKGFRDRGGFVSDSYAYFLGGTMPVDPVEPEEEKDPEWYFGLNNETSPILDANGQSYRAAA